MNFTFLIFILIVSEICLAIPSYYNGPTYSNEREIENAQMLSSHQKKRLLSDDNSQYREEQGQPEEEHAAAAGYERFRKFQPGSAGEPAFSQRSRLEHEQIEYEPEAKEKREYFEGNPAANKDSSIEVILDPKAKKAVAVVENSPTGQAMYDLTGWKNAKEDVSALDNDQYAQQNQEQVVNLVYPAERSANMERGERKYNPGAAEAFEASNTERKYENFEGNSEYGGNRLVKAPARERAAIVETDQRLDDTHKKKRNAEIMKRSTLDSNVQLDSEKRSVTQEKRKASSDSKQNECPPHNAPSSSGEASATGDTSTENSNVNKDSADIKREASPHWTQDQIDALTSSVVKARDNNAEMGNLKAILIDMGLVDTQFPQKREITTNEQENAIMKEKLDKMNENKRDLQQKTENNEEEDANQENVILKRNDREINNEDEKWEMDINDAPQEPIEKREIKTENAQENKEETDNTNKDVKRSNEESVETPNADDDATTRKKRQNSDKKDEENIQQDAAKDVNSNIANIDSNVESLKKYNKREADDKPKEKRKLEEDDFEKKMENQIQAKIDAIKEKVKREILEEQRKRSKRYSIDSTPDLSIVEKPSSRLRRESIADTANIGSITANEKSEAYNKNTRKKRANILPEKQMIYRPFQAEQDDESEEDGEFDDNNFDNRIYLQKRQAADDDFQYFDARNREISPYMQPNYYPQSRSRRSFETDYSDAESSAFHGGGMMVNRKTNSKNIGFNDREKRGDTFNDQESENTDENENIENSDNEYFGSLPQAYNGELTRYKRVKRDNPYK